MFLYHLAIINGKQHKPLLLLVVVVDDMILASATTAAEKAFAVYMHKQYDIKEMGQPQYMIGVKLDINHSLGTIGLSQTGYIEDMYAKHHNPCYYSKDMRTDLPASPSMDLTKAGMRSRNAAATKSPCLPNATTYRSLVGALMYSLITRPDVATAVSKCAKYMANPTHDHMKAAQRILVYLYTTRSLNLTYSLSTKLGLTCFVDASWADDKDNRRSRFGYAIFLGRNLICWKSKMHASCSMSTAEAEYVAATEAAKQLKWIHYLLTDIGISVPLPIPCYEDNDACRQMCNNHVISGRNKHVELKQHYIREQVQARFMTMLNVDTADQIGDIFTKNLPKPSFTRHRRVLLHGLEPNHPALQTNKQQKHL